MKRTAKRLVMLMTMLLVLTMAAGATIAWGSVTVPTKGKKYVYNSSTKKWVKTDTSFTATFSGSGKLKKYTFTYGPNDKSTVTYTWSGDRLKKYKSSYTGAKTHTATYSYKNGKPSKVSGKSFKTVYKWKGNKGTITQTAGKEKYKYKMTLKNGRISSETELETSAKWTYSYYQRGLRKKTTYKSKNGKTISTYGKNGFLKKRTSGSSTTTYNWKKNEVIITNKDNGKVTGKYKWKFSKTKRVSRVWNCDATGFSTYFNLY